MCHKLHGDESRGEKARRQFLKRRQEKMSKAGKKPVSEFPITHSYEMGEHCKYQSHYYGVAAAVKIELGLDLGDWEVVPHVGVSPQLDTHTVQCTDNCCAVPKGAYQSKKQSKQPEPAIASPSQGSTARATQPTQGGKDANPGRLPCIGVTCAAFMEHDALRSRPQPVTPEQLFLREFPVAHRPQWHCDCCFGQEHYSAKNTILISNSGANCTLTCTACLPLNQHHLDNISLMKPQPPDSIMAQ